VEFRPTRAWAWRGGVAFDETPVPSAALRTPRLPDNDRTWLALGFSWSPAARLRLDFAYAHLVIEESRIDSVEVNTGHRLVGKYENATDIVSAQLQWRF
jgi:long-chain fatty acid transport protein